MNDRDTKDLEVFRRFMSGARGHGNRYSDERTSLDRAIEEAERLRQMTILKLGTFPDDSVIVEHAKRQFAMRVISSLSLTIVFDELDPGTRECWIRASRIALVSFFDEAYRRLADATARRTIGHGLDEILYDNIRDGWIQAAEVALHVRAKLWDTQYIRQNIAGMTALLEELGSCPNTAS